MKADRSAVTARTPMELVFINAFGKFQNNFMDIFEHIKSVVKSRGRHKLFLYLSVQPALNFTITLLKNSRLFTAFFKSKWARSRKAASLGRIHQTRRLARDEHRV